MGKKYRVFLQFCNSKISVVTDWCDYKNDAEDKMKEIKESYRKGTFKLSFIDSNLNSDSTTGNNKLILKAISFREHIENEFYSYFEDCVERYGFDTAKDSLILNSSDELFTGPFLVCDSFHEYVELAESIISKFLELRRK